MVSYLTKLFGLSHLNLAEDVVQDTLCQALQVWPVHGYPENPSAWLMRVAKHRAIDVIRRARTLREVTPELEALLGEAEGESEVDELALDREIQDDQLRMMFSCCHPALSIDAQVTLILKTLCGFSVAEIANALLVSEDSVEKRLVRARKALRESKSLMTLGSPSEIAGRLEAVYQAIYLLFNEGYHGSQSEVTVREELCYEALRLGTLLTEHPSCARPKTFALLSLLCFHAARLPGRVGEDGCLLQLATQDRSKWDQLLIGVGLRYLARAAVENELSDFHVEAAIASLHSRATSYEATDWLRIKELYDLLYEMRRSPVVALNRAIALGHLEGPERGLAALSELESRERLLGYPFFFAALAEFQRALGKWDAAQLSFERAVALARNPAEQRFLKARAEAAQNRARVD